MKKKVVKQADANEIPPKFKRGELVMFCGAKYRIASVQKSLYGYSYLLKGFKTYRAENQLEKVEN